VLVRPGSSNWFPWKSVWSLSQTACWL